jgi:hypothetical protein
MTNERVGRIPTGGAGMKVYVCYGTYIECNAGSTYIYHVFTEESKAKEWKDGIKERYTTFDYEEMEVG